MNIAFLNPPFRGTYNREVRFQAVSPQKALHPPIMLGYATEICRSSGHKVDLIDAPALGISEDESVQRVANLCPEYVVMLTSTASVQSDAVLAQRIAAETGAKTVAIGVHATAVPQDTLQRGFDVVARGEYDYTVKDIAQGKALEKVDGISFKKGKRIIHNKARALIKNLDELPFPARDFLPNRKYYSALYKNPFTFVLAGRGCPHQCIYCAGPQLMSGRGYRMRSPGNVVAELKQIKRDFPYIKSVLFNDDTLNVNKPYILKLCNLIEKEKVNMPWAAYSRVDSVDREIASAMRKAGCFLVKVGFESGCDELLHSMRKGARATTEQARKCAKYYREAGIQVHGTFVFGMPGETVATIKKTVEFAKQLDLDFVQFSVAQPYPGTEFYRYLESKGYLRFKQWSDYLDSEGRITPIFEYPNLSKADMCYWIKQGYKEYYLRPHYIAKALRQRFTHWSLFKTSLKSAWSLLNYIRS